jgi:hypothetical protein
MIMSWRKFLLAIGAVSVCCQLAGADKSFAIKTQVFSDGKDQPVAENVTIFQADKVYDFTDTRPASVTVLDTKTLRFVLARRDEQIQTVLSTEELVRFAATQTAEAQQSDNDLVRFAGNPTFVESFDAESGRLTLTSPLWDYRVETRRMDDQEMLRRYAEFATWYTYLNAVFRPLPPGVRLELNAALDRHHCLPEHVVVRIKRNGKVVVEQQSRHELISPLGKRERSQIATWQQEQADFRSVDFATYRAVH